jgi:two-component system, sensor histidine kinase
MSRLLNALLDISKLESGAVKPQPADFRVGTLFEPLRREFAGLAATRNSQLATRSGELSGGRRQSTC